MITIIGTLHAGLTDHRELESIIQEHHPDHLLIEIAQEDIDNENISGYPDEMVFAYDWAKKNDVKVNGFDSKMSVQSKKTNEEDEEKVIKLQKEVIKKHDWKDFNKEEYNKLLDVQGHKELIDEEIWKKREEEMLSNIKSLTNENEKTLVLTGAGHIAFFEINLPKAKFPLRN